MQIFTLACQNCGTIVAANELEKNRAMKCPGISCERVLRFDQLPKDHRKHIDRNRDKYKMD